MQCNTKVYLATISARSGPVDHQDTCRACCHGGRIPNAVLNKISPLQPDELHAKVLVNVVGATTPLEDAYLKKKYELTRENLRTPARLPTSSAQAIGCTASTAPSTHRFWTSICPSPASLSCTTLTQRRRRSSSAKTESQVATHLLPRIMLVQQNRWSLHKSLDQHRVHHHQDHQKRKERI